MKFAFFVLATFLFSLNANAKNLHLIDKSWSGGFAIYRTGAPNEKDMKELCALGVQEMMVLSGNADKKEDKYHYACPTLKVIYNEKQSPTKPLTKEFLEAFDNWVQEAQALGKAIAFRCNCGCHRTGRLAAYYQMKYQNLTWRDAVAIMKEHGKFMFLYPSLDNQVRGLYAYIHGEECKEGKYCVVTEREQESYSYPEYTDKDEEIELKSIGL